VYSKNRHNSFYVKNKTSKVCFQVRHFAGPVEYTVGREPKQGELTGFSRDWLDKNSDELSALVVDCMLHSSSGFVKELFAEKAAAVAGSASSKISLGGQFRNQLISLLENLRKTEPHFVRCVKSNNKKKAATFDGFLVLEQLKYAGLFEAIRIRKAGYAYRASHEEFALQYMCLVPGLVRARTTNLKYFNYREACSRIIKQENKVLDSDVAKIGHSKVFIKENRHRIELDHRLRAKLDEYYKVIFRFGKECIILIRTRGEREKLRIEKERRLAEEKRKIIEIELAREKLAKQAIVIQKYVRRFQVRQQLDSIRDLVELRRVLDASFVVPGGGDKVELVKAIIHRIEQKWGVGGAAATTRRSSTKSVRGSAAAAAASADVHPLRLMFAQEVAIARTMMKLIEIQDTFRRDMNQAVEDCDVVALNKLIVRADRLDMTNDPIVKDARSKLKTLHSTRIVMKKMVAFLRNEYEYQGATDPQELLRDAHRLGIDELFISKVRRVYEGAGPRLQARSRLRAAVETVHRSAIEHGLAEIEAMQAFKGRENFAEAERRAGRLMLRFLCFENQLCPDAGARSHSHLSASFSDFGLDDDGDGGAEYGLDTGPRLTGEMIELCDEICSTSSLDAARAAKRRLQQLGGGATGLEEIIRCYKWSKLLCTWKYPETRLATTAGGAAAGGTDSDAQPAAAADAAAGAKDAEFEFFGLRASEARSSVFLIRMLHCDIDPTQGSGASGDTPPSMQAALGALDLPANVRETMDKLERSCQREDAERMQEAKSEDVARIKKASQGLHGAVIGEKGTGKMTGVTLRRIQAQAAKPKKEKVAVKNIKAKALHAYDDLAAELEAKLLESRSNLDKQIHFRDDSIVRLDRYKKKEAFRA